MPKAAACVRIASPTSHATPPKPRASRKQPTNDEEEEDQQQQQNNAHEQEDEEDDLEVASCTSNQIEDDLGEENENDPEDAENENDDDRSSRQENDWENARVLKSVKTEPLLLLLPLPPPLTRSSAPTKMLPTVLSVQVADPKKKGIQEPRPPRASSGLASNQAVAATTTSKGDAKKTRHKFQFPDAELLTLVLEETMAASAALTASSSSAIPTSSRGIAFNQKRRYSSTAAVAATTLPLRRKSFSLTKSSPAKKQQILAELPAMPSPAKTRFQTRRKSTSACYSLKSGARSPLFINKTNSGLVSSLPPLTARSSQSLATTTSTSSSSSSAMVLRVRERKSDGIPELVISKRPARVVVWNWQDRQLRIPFQITLGPHQHSIMLRQLRYVKSVMNDLPWAKTHLKDLLAAYTKKDTSKEELYPQLNHLSSQVQQEISTQVKKQKQLVVKKQRLTMQLSLATSVLNELHVTKYGRRGKPHETRLNYDPGQPTKLHWVRKNGERSAEFLEVDLLEIHCYEHDVSESELSVGMKKATKKFTPTLHQSVSLVTPARALDLELKSALHREWLVNALADVVSFARQYKAAGARCEHAHVLRRM